MLPHMVFELGTVLKHFRFMRLRRTSPLEPVFLAHMVEPRLAMLVQNVRLVADIR